MEEAAGDTTVEGEIIVVLAESEVEQNDRRMDMHIVLFLIEGGKEILTEHPFPVGFVLPVACTLFLFLKSKVFEIKFFG